MRQAGGSALRRSLAAAVLLAAILVPAVAFASTTIGVSTPRFDLTVAPGSNGSGDLVLTNDGTQPVAVKVYFADQVTAANGDISYVAPGPDADPLSSPALWFSTSFAQPAKAIGNMPYLETKPGDHIQVKFTFTVPANAKPGDQNVILFFETFDPTQAMTGASGSIGSRLGSRIHLQIQGHLVESVDVRPFDVPALVIGDSVPFSYTVRNDGNVDEHVGGALLLLDRSENIVASSPVATATALFGQSVSQRSGKLSAPGFGPGPYTARLTLTYATAPDSSVTKQVVKSLTVWVLPVWSVAAAGGIVVLLIVALALGIGRRGRRGRTTERRSASSDRSRRGAPRGRHAAGHFADDQGEPTED